MKTTKKLQVKQEGSNLQQIFATFSVCYLCISCGNFLGYTSSAIPSMKEDLITFPELNDHDTSWIGGLFPLGALVGAVFTTFPIHRFGSRRTIGYFASPVMITAWCTIAFSNSLLNILIGRFLGGISSGIVIACCPLYVIDISSIVRRGRLGIFPQLLMISGILISYILGSFLEWRSLAKVCAVITVPSFVLLFFGTDTPNWLLSRNLPDKAMQAIERLHGSNEAVSILQHIQIKSDRARHNRETFSGVRKNPIDSAAIKASAVVLGLMSFQQLTGINGVTFYSVHIFRQTAGVSIWGAHIPSIILVSVQCLASFTSGVIVDRAGRKVLLLISSVLISVSAGTMGTYFYFAVESQYLFWVPLVALIVFAFAFAIGFGPVTWILCAELLPEEIRPIMNPLAISYNWFCVFLVTKSFPLLMTEINIYGIFWLYAGIAILGFLFTLLFVPETKGKTVAEIRQFFGGVINDDRDNEMEDKDSRKCLNESKFSCINE